MMINVYFVIDHPGLGPVRREADPQATDLETVIKNLRATSEPDSQI
jgi:hypothetical protein